MTFTPAVMTTAITEEEKKNLTSEFGNSRRKQIVIGRDDLEHPLTLCLRVEFIPYSYKKKYTHIQHPLNITFWYNA